MAHSTSTSRLHSCRSFASREACLNRWLIFIFNFFFAVQTPAFTPPAPITAPLFGAGDQQPPQQQQPLQPSPVGMYICMGLTVHRRDTSIISLLHHQRTFLWFTTQSFLPCPRLEESFDDAPLWGYSLHSKRLYSFWARVWKTWKSRVCKIRAQNYAGYEGCYQ